MSSGAASHNASVVRYFNLSGLDYRLLWSNRHNRALHMGYWDRSMRSHGESLLRMNQELAAPLRLRPGMRVLDAGCGIGGSALWLAERYDAEVVGVTLSPRQARSASRAAKRRGLAHRVRFEAGDFCDTGFAPASFDVVWVQESACYALDKLDFLNEAARVLRPGGQLAVEDGFRTGRDFPAEVEARLREAFLYWAVDDFSTLEEFASQAREAGFERIDCRDEAYPSARRLHRIAALLKGPEHLAYLLRLRPLTVHRNFLGALEQVGTFDDKLCTMELVHAATPRSGAGGYTVRRASSARNASSNGSSSSNRHHNAP